jgi:hypothetical protein
MLRIKLFVSNEVHQQLMRLPNHVLSPWNQMQLEPRWRIQRDLKTPRRQTFIVIIPNIRNLPCTMMTCKGKRDSAHRPRSDDPFRYMLLAIQSWLDTPFIVTMMDSSGLFCLCTAIPRPSPLYYSDIGRNSAFTGYQEFGVPAALGGPLIVPPSVIH